MFGEFLREVLGILRGLFEKLLGEDLEFIKGCVRSCYGGGMKNLEKGFKNFSNHPYEVLIAA